MLNPSDYELAVSLQSETDIEKVLYWYRDAIEKIGADTGWTRSAIATHPISVLYASQILFLTGICLEYDREKFKEALRISSARARGKAE